MPKEIILEGYVDYDGILTNAERKKILNRIESAFSTLGATIPKEVEIDGEKYKLDSEIRNLILKEKLSVSERLHVKKLIRSLEGHGKLLKSLIKNGSISEEEAMEASDKICGLLRAVHELRELIGSAPKAKALDAKESLMLDVEDKKRWIKYTRQID